MEKTRMWDPGNNKQKRRGFTLLELLLVVAIIAMASAGVGLALREQGQAQLEREAQRLVALLEAARAQSRGSGLVVVWHADALGFVFEGLPLVGPAAQPVPAALEARGSPAPTPWLAAGMSVQHGAPVVLGPEPIIGRQTIDLILEGRSLRISTDGLRPFAILDGGVPTGVEP